MSSSRTGEDADHPAAKVRVGIDTGEALAVNNGRRGHREPLFLGEPADTHCQARTARGRLLDLYGSQTLGLNRVANEDTTALTIDEIEASQTEASLESSPTTS